MQKPKIPGLFTGMKITFGELMKTLFPKGRGIKRFIPAPTIGAVTVQYPHESETPAPRSRGVIALKEENCTVCMLCSRSCPDWCIYIEGHKTKAPPRRPGGKERTVSALDRFDIDYALCMYCGICVEVCPFDALFWSPEYEYSEPKLADLLHDMSRLGEWMETVPDFEDYEAGSAAKVRKVPRSMVAQNIFFYLFAAVITWSAIRVVTTKNVVHAALYLVGVLAAVGAEYILLAAEFVAATQVLVYIGAIVVLFLFGVMLTRARIGQEQDLTHRGAVLGGIATSVFLFGVMAYSLIDEFGWTRTPLPADTRIAKVVGSNSATVSDSIFSTYLVPFEVVSVLLLAALVGAIVLARKD